MISAIISAIIAILAEFFCSDAKAKMFWLGAVSLYFLVSCVAFRLLWKDSFAGNLSKQILVFIVVAMSAFVASILAASTVMSVLDRFTDSEKGPQDDQETTDEGQEENNATG
ncbi:MAG: hypothetical protein K5696_13005 [Lachnospiraceae bacterium]|nr:hypothetical protein [Lachnospiraceae bacterium]